MKKTLIATAIAAVAFSGTTMAQSTATSADSRADELASRMDSMPTVYGNIQYVVYHDNIDGGPSNLEHADNGSTLGVKHEHEIVPGITGFFKLELEGLAADDKDRETGLEDVDEAYIGVKGDSFGQLWIGSDDSTYESAIEEIKNYYEYAALNTPAGYTTGEGDLVQYKTPSFSGLTLAAAVQINGDGDDQDLDDKGDKKSYPYQLAAIYEVDALELAFAMDSNDNAERASNENTYGARASYNMGNLRLTGEYHTTKDAFDKFGVIGYYTLGANTFALSYEQNTDDESDDKTDTITLQALHNLSDNMYVYFEGYLGGGDEVYEYEDDLGGEAFSDERSQAAIGAVYYF